MIPAKHIVVRILKYPSRQAIRCACRAGGGADGEECAQWSGVRHQVLRVTGRLQRGACLVRAWHWPYRHRPCAVPSLGRFPLMLSEPGMLRLEHLLAPSLSGVMHMPGED
jgi:hypothetical protein